MKCDSKLKTTIVFGGGGFLGRYLVDSLLCSGREILAAGRRPRDEVKLPNDCGYIQGDCGDRDFLRKILKPGCDVVHLAYATVPKTSYDDPVFDLLSNVSPSVALLQECLGAEVAKLLVVSSGGTIYGNALSSPITELQATHPISPYGITKLTIEKYAQMFCKASGLNVVIARPSNAYGEGQAAGTGQGCIAAAMRAAFSGSMRRVYGGSECVRDYIHVQDCAAGLVAVLDHGIGGESYNLGTGGGKSNKDVVDAICDLAEKSGKRLKAEYRAKRVFDVAHNVLDCSKLRDLSGWKPRISFQEGLERVWGNLRESPALETKGRPLKHVGR